MKLYWSPRSPFVRKVMACAHEIGLANRIETVYALVTLDRTNAEVMQVNPLGRIPTLITDEGETLYDSAVICEYLDTLHGGERLFPQHGPRRWDALRRHALADGILEKAVLWLGERKRAPGMQSTDLLAAFEAKIASGLAQLESEAPSFADAPVDIGHITTAGVLNYLDFRFADFAWRIRAPQLAGWYSGFAERPAMQATMHYQES
jgi:glutathione S-transferase